MKERFILDRIVVSLYREVMRPSIDFVLALRPAGGFVARNFIYPVREGHSCVNVEFSEPMILAFGNKIFGMGIK